MQMPSSIAEVRIHAKRGRGKGAGGRERGHPSFPSLFFFFSQVVDIVPGRFVLAAVADADAFTKSEFARGHIVYSIDEELVSLGGGALMQPRPPPHVAV